jgi:hypothetical protein
VWGEVVGEKEDINLKKKIVIVIRGQREQNGKATYK